MISSPAAYNVQPRYWYSGIIIIKVTIARLHLGGARSADQVPLHRLTMDPETDGGQGDHTEKCWSGATEKSSTSLKTVDLVRKMMQNLPAHDCVCVFNIHKSWVSGTGPYHCSFVCQWSIARRKTEFVTRERERDVPWHKDIINPDNVGVTRAADWDSDQRWPE